MTISSEVPFHCKGIVELDHFIRNIYIYIYIYYIFTYINHTHTHTHIYLKFPNISNYILDKCDWVHPLNFLLGTWLAYVAIENWCLFWRSGYLSSFSHKLTHWFWDQYGTLHHCQRLTVSNGDAAPMLYLLCITYSKRKWYLLLIVFSVMSTLKQWSMCYSFSLRALLCITYSKWKGYLFLFVFFVRSTLKR